MRRLLLIIIMSLVICIPHVYAQDTYVLNFGGPDWSGLISDMVPAVDNTYDIGSSTYEWKDMYIDGKAYIDGIGEPFTLDNGATSSGYFDIYEDSDNGSNYLRIDIPDTLSSNYTQTFPAQTGTVMNNLVEDTTPQLGGNLDIQSNDIEGVDATEFGYLDGVTSDIQTQLDGKEGTLSNEAGLYSALSDVSDFVQPSECPLDSDFGSNGIMERTAAGSYGIATAGTDYTSPSSTESFTNKTLDANGTGNTVKGYGYIVLANPHMAGSGLTAGMDTTNTNEYYGQVTFSNSTDEATNYAEYRLTVPYDIDTSVDLVAWFKFRLGGADTADHDYVLSMDSVADSGDYTGTPANSVNLSYTADGSGASGDVETAGGDTLTDWKSNVTAGQHWVIRIARDGDDGTNDASTVDSYSGTLVIRYGFTQ